MSNNPDKYCIFGSNMKTGLEMTPFDAITDYLMILPIILGLVVLGKIFASPNKQFKLIYLIIALILVGDLSIVIINSYYSCITEVTIKQKDWFTVVFTGSKAQNFVLFIWLYMWEATRHAKEKEAKLQEMAKQEDASLTPEQKMKKFTSDVENFVAKHEKSRKWFLRKFYGALVFEILLDITFFVLFLKYDAATSSKELKSLIGAVLFFQGLDIIFVTCLLILAFNGLRKILKAYPRINVSKWQVFFNLFTVVAIFINKFLPEEYANFREILEMLFQLNLLWFCWNFVTMPKNAGGKEPLVANLTGTQIAQQLEQMADNLAKVKVEEA